MAVAIAPYIPQYVTVHLGRPEANASNVTVTFPNYIKNVASSEIYPTWPESSLIANIYAQISFALNKIYTEFYRSRGYAFDITNSTSIDQAFVPGRNIFDNISRLVDDIFNTYIRRQGYLEPLAAEFCNGTTVTCNGMSQWGTVPLAQQGYTPYSILTYYYGDDIDLVRNTPVAGIRESYPGSPISNGAQGSSVSTIQVMLNRISQNYPAIPKVYPVDGIFGPATQRAVETFQQIFGLAVDGIVGRATWYKMVFLYVGIKRLNELESEGVSIFGLNLQYPDAVKEGDTGEKVSILQYFLSSLSAFYQAIPPLAIDGYFGPETKNAVLAYQKLFNLPQTGEADEQTWNDIYDTFMGVVRVVETYSETGDITIVPYPGTPLQTGSRGEDVVTLQQYLNFVSNTYPSIPPVKVTGIFGTYTRYSVMAFQKLFGLPQTGVVDERTWNTLTDAYFDTATATTSRLRQFPGYTLREGSTDHNNK